VINRKSHFSQHRAKDKEAENVRGILGNKQKAMAKNKTPKPSKKEKVEIRKQSESLDMEHKKNSAGVSARVEFKSIFAKS
jgi:hypothetical protein